MTSDDFEDRVNDAVRSGEYQSKGAARRALSAELETFDTPLGGPSWVGKIAAGLAGARPGLR